MRTDPVLAPVPGEFLLADAAGRHSANTRLNAEGPVHPVRLRSGATGFLVTGYDVVRQALSDPRLQGRTGAVGNRRALPGDIDRGMNTHMLNMGAADHARLRRLVSAAFTRRRMEAMRPQVEQVADQLLDAVADRDRVDLVESYALPLPVRVISRMVGVPDEDAASFHAWTEVLTSGAVGLDELVSAASAMLAYTRDLIVLKRRTPGDDLLSALVAVRDDGDRLSEDELTSMVFLLLIAGHETTVNLIANGVHALLTEPAQLSRLRADRRLLPAAIEEFLRIESPVQVALRHATEPLVLAGVPIPAGSAVLVSLLAAGRDPSRFPRPDGLDVGRADTRHLSFGHGIHHCLGAPLARLEGRIAIGALLDRFPRLRLDAPSAGLSWSPSLVMHGLAELPVRLK